MFLSQRFHPVYFFAEKRKCGLPKPTEFNRAKAQISFKNLVKYIFSLTSFIKLKIFFQMCKTNHFNNKFLLNKVYLNTYFLYLEMLYSIHYKILPLSNISADVYISIHNKFQSHLSDRKIPLLLEISNLRISDTARRGSSICMWILKIVNFFRRD